jgi:hypothetical protein
LADGVVVSSANCAKDLGRQTGQCAPIDSIELSGAVANPDQCANDIAALRRYGRLSISAPFEAKGFQAASANPGPPPTGQSASHDVIDLSAALAKRQPGLRVISIAERVAELRRARKLFAPGDWSSQPCT